MQEKNKFRFRPFEKKIENVFCKPYPERMRREEIRKKIILQCTKVKNFTGAHALSQGNIPILTSQGVLRNGTIF